MLESFMVGAVVSLGTVLIGSSLLYRPNRLARRIWPHVATRSTAPRRSGLRERAGQVALKVLETVGSTRATVERRLEMLGEGSLTSFRLHQLQWAAIGGGLGIVFAFALVTRGVPPVLALLAVAVGIIGGALAADSHLTRRVATRSQSYTRELPDVVELLALAVGSGEPIRVAIERVARMGAGDLITELQRTMGDVRSGNSLSEALNAMGQRASNTNVSRFTDAVVGSLELGSGLSKTLHTQARDSRDAARRELIELGGKAEISMMVPVVFLILPVTVLFTLFPALSALNFT